MWIKYLCVIILLTASAQAKPKSKDLSLSNLSPSQRTEEDAPVHYSDHSFEAERVSIDDIPMIKFSSDKGTIYLPNISPEAISPKALEQAQCAANLGDPIRRDRSISRVEMNATGEFKPFIGAILSTIQSKCENGSGRNEYNTSVKTPEVELGIAHNPKVKKPGDELKSNKAFVHPSSGTVGVGSSF